MSNKKYIVVCWSGGYDSTLVLYNTLKEEYNKTRRDTTPNITAYSVNWDLIDEKKSESEIIVRNKFKTKMKKLGYEFRHEVIDLKMTNAYDVHGLPQQTLWTFLTSYCIPNDSIVKFGYHQGDDFWRYWGTFEKIKKYILQSLCKRNIEFNFPLENTKKYKIVNDIKKNKLINCVWTCESPKDVMVACGKCIPCINLTLAKYESRLMKKISPPISNEKIIVKDERKKNS